ATLERHPQIATALDPIAPLLTDAVMRGLNEAVDGEKLDPADVARDFLGRHHLV
ncbi:MAG: quaternary ammonium transporter, partial [Candidatus Eremiobacteraeota bacterium]|nr:quaternary ammonium transporter [Candidatus Eremiobacteraeota bacterium]